MKKVEITLKVLTPMFSFGEDNNKKDSLAEFRITELKALMRSTFRELYDFENLTDMKEKEAALFGDNERKSPLTFKAYSIKSDSTEKQDMLPHKTLEKIHCLDKSKKISFSMIVSNSLSLEFYINLLLQASIIGSLGKRSRKGFGSFKIIDIKDDNNSYDKFVRLLNKNPLDILKNEESSIIKIRKVQNLNIEEFKSSISFLDLYDYKSNLDYPYAKKVTLLKLGKNQEYLNLLKKISQLTHERLISEEDNDFTSSIDNKVKINRNILGNCKKQIKDLNRYAAPIYVSFSENDNSRYMIIKELNYNYVLGNKNLDIKSQEEKIANKDYIGKYINELIEIGKGNR